MLDLICQVIALDAQRGKLRLKLRDPRGVVSHRMLPNQYLLTYTCRPAGWSFESVRSAVMRR